MRFDIVTIFPRIFDSYFSESIIKLAIQKKKIQIKVWNLRDFAVVKQKKGPPARMWNFRQVDDSPYGGGAGMVLMAEPIIKAVDQIVKNKKTKIVLFSAKGKQFNQRMAYDWSKKFDQLVLITGRYEGIDERVKIVLKAEEVSMGPYVLTDGEVPAMAVVSAVTRLIPGAIKLESLAEESHWNLLIKGEKAVKNEEKGLEYPHYTRPEILKWKGKKYRVPKVLLSGNHRKIEEWRRSHTH